MWWHDEDVAAVAKAMWDEGMADEWQQLEEDWQALARIALATLLDRGWTAPADAPTPT